MTGRWRFAWAWTVATVLAASALAQDPAPAPSPKPCDPAATPCVAFEGYLITERVWDARTDPVNVVGARMQAELRVRRWRFAVRGDATGAPGEFDQTKVETVRALEGYFGAAYDWLVLPGSIRIGPGAGIGGEVLIEKAENGTKLGLPRQMTAGLGLRASGPGWWGYAVAGSNQTLPRFAVTATWQVALSDRVASVGQVAVCAGAWTAKTGLGVRWK